MATPKGCIDLMVPAATWAIAENRCGPLIRQAQKAPIQFADSALRRAIANAYLQGVVDAGINLKLIAGAHKGP